MYDCMSPMPLASFKSNKVDLGSSQTEKQKCMQVKCNDGGDHVHDYDEHEHILSTNSVSGVCKDL